MSSSELWEERPYRGATPGGGTHCLFRSSLSFLCYRVCRNTPRPWEGCGSCWCGQASQENITLTLPEHWSQGPSRKFHARYQVGWALISLEDNSPLMRIRLRGERSCDFHPERRLPWWVRSHRVDKGHFHCRHWQWLGALLKDLHTDLRPLIAIGHPDSFLEGRGGSGWKRNCTFTWK